MENWKLARDDLEDMINTYGINNILEVVFENCSMLEFIDYMNKRAEEYKNDKT